MTASHFRSIRRIALSATLASLSSLAFAQTPAAPAAAAASVPESTCVSPGDLPSIRPGQNTMENFQKKVDAYGVCMKAYVAEQQAGAEAARLNANARIEAANAAVKAYNDYINKLNEQQAKGQR